MASTTTATTTTLRAAQKFEPIRAEDDKPFQGLARGDRRGILKLRGIPRFEDLHEQRKWIRQHMAAVFRFFGKRQWGEGVSGHISVRGKMSSSRAVLQKSML